ncbi:MAG: bifunctional folylpolyglutamate synthase/dihydrofolate synthase, partial [Spirochaetes bacterium]|nr:bifunctional folylpolyglutamate synthase/dihydrofolate synthase [Spirochaetota bacterium]
MKTIDEVLDYLYSFINYETDSSYSYESIHYNVDRTRRLLELLNNPERDKKIIHVAGTKGKGSVCHI